MIEKAIVLVADLCTGCGRCIPPCPPGALTLEAEKPDGCGRKMAVVDSGRCLGCGACFAACPRQALGFGPSAGGEHR